MRDPYAVLGLDATANAAAIKQAFRLRAKALHPDANPGDPVAAAAFRELTEAYAILSDPGLKSEIDAELGQGEIRRPGGRRPDKGPSFRASFQDPVREMWPERGPEPPRVADPDFPYKDAWEREVNRLHVAPPHPGHWPEEPWTAMEAAGLDPEQANPPEGAPPNLSDHFEEGGGAPGPDLFDELYASPDLGRRRSRKAKRHEALDQHYTATIPFMLAALGGHHRVILAGDRDLNVPIAVGIEEGAVLRFHGLGSANPSGGEAGDALLEIRIAPHPLFRREGADLFVEVPIDLKEATLGGSVRIPTLKGSVLTKLPPALGARAKLRLTGRGLPMVAGDMEGARGDQILELKLVMPKEPDPALLSFLESWTPGESPRDESGFNRHLSRSRSAHSDSEEPD